MRRVSWRAQASAAAAAAALGFAGVAAAQDDEASANVELCGVAFASSGTASGVSYAAGQLRACDALVARSRTAAELDTALETIITAHGHVLARWEAVAEELVAAAAAPARPASAADDDAAAAADPWAAKLAERHAIETAMDGLRILMRLSYQLAETYSDPRSLAAALEGDAAAQVNDVLASRRVCASAGRLQRGNDAATPPSWYAFADIVPTDEDETPVEYGREVVDDVAEIAEAFVATDLASAPSLRISALTSFVEKFDCPRREFPSENPPA